MDPATLAALEPERLRQLLPHFLSSTIDGAEARARSLSRMNALIGAWDDETCRTLAGNLVGLGEEPRIYDPHPQAREMSRAWCRDVITELEVEGVHHLVEAAAAGPVVVLANHLSYMDSTAIDAALAWSDVPELADALVSLAGPRVYTDTFRRVATSCLATLPVPQSTQFAHTESLSPRELARRALASVKAGEQGIRAGRHLLIFGEGSRSRDGRLQPFLQGIHRYLAVEGTIVVPVALVGTREIMPVGRTHFTPGTLSLRIGEPLPVAEHGGSRSVLDPTHDALSSLLPDELQPA